jgi:hypothetical protein
MKITKQEAEILFNLINEFEIHIKPKGFKLKNSERLLRTKISNEFGIFNSPKDLEF